MSVHKLSTRLSDGRRLIYFDSSPRRVAASDARPLPQEQQVGQIRYDALTHEWVTVAGHRQTRTFLPSQRSCPLCPSSSENQTEIPESSYEVVIFENRFPSLSAPVKNWELPNLEPFAQAENAGTCEVVCFTDDHNSTFSELSPERVGLVIEAWQDRTADLLSKDFIEYVFIFENFGQDIGVTISHPHGQIYGYPFVPSRALQSLSAIKSYARRTGRHVVDDIIVRELSEESRIVEITKHWVSFVPFAARWPFQLQIHPRTPVARFTHLSEEMKAELADFFPRALRQVSGLFDQEVPYIAAWNQAPNGPLEPYGRLYLDLFTTRRASDKLKYLAGSESAMGAFVNDILPEQAAEMLRGVGVH